MKLYEEFSKYEVTSDGRIINISLNREVSQRGNDYSYKVVCLSDNNGKPRFVKVHRLVASKFVPSDDETLEVNHIDGNKSNNNADNLEWVTSRENKIHAWENGLYTHKGESHYLSKLTDDDVRKICEMLSSGCRAKEVADLFDTTKDVINNIKSGRSWKHISSLYNMNVQRKARRSLKTIEMICQDIANGMSMKELLSKYTDIPRSELRRILNKKIHINISCNYF